MLTYALIHVKRRCSGSIASSPKATCHSVERSRLIAPAPFRAAYFDASIWKWPATSISCSTASICINTSPLRLRGTRSSTGAITAPSPFSLTCSCSGASVAKTWPFSCDEHRSGSPASSSRFSASRTLTYTSGFGALRGSKLMWYRAAVSLRISLARAPAFSFLLRASASSRAFVSPRPESASVFCTQCGFCPYASVCRKVMAALAVARFRFSSGVPVARFGSSRRVRPGYAAAVMMLLMEISRVVMASSVGGSTPRPLCVARNITESSTPISLTKIAPHSLSRAGPAAQSFSISRTMAQRWSDSNE